MNMVHTPLRETATDLEREMSERVAVFVDGSNFYHACRENLGRTGVDLGAFSTWLVGVDRSLVRTYYYNCPLPPDEPEQKRTAQQRFFGALARAPYLEVRLGRLSPTDVYCPACGTTVRRYVEKGVDMRIGVDMLSLASRGLFDVAVLVSGDGDLAEAVRAVKELGKHVELAALPKGRSWELVQAADLVREITPADMQPFMLSAAAAVGPVSGARTTQGHS
ncbi:MAG: NYN domain-containing protein [Candidatus Dormibacteraeota bacterium]|nr:NYN domain-containing protein [Candidatus Dormibacteraeota bacterium]